MFRILRFAALVLAACLALFSQTPPNLSPDDRQLLWEEAVYTHNGMLYQMKFHYFPSQEAAEQARSNTRGLWAAKAPVRELNMLYNEIPYRMRENIAALQEGAYSAPMLMPNTKDWVIVELIDKLAAKFEVSRDYWLDRYAAIALPPPSELRSNPAYIARRVLNSIRHNEDLAQALASGRITRADLDRRCSDGSTLLIHAIYRRDLELARNLLALGANPDASSPQFAPLDLAALLGHTNFALLLLQHKADPNGLPDHLSPLMAACSNGDRAMAQMLLDAGADPLATRDEWAGTFRITRSTLFYVSSQNMTFHTWFKRVVDEALRKTAKYEWSAWIEQDGQRAEIRPGKAIPLKKKPFRFILKLYEDVAFRVIASVDKSLARQMEDPAFHRAALSGVYVGACNAESNFLSTANIERNEEGYFDGSVFSTNEWGYPKNPEVSQGTHPSPDKQGEFFHEVEEFLTPERNVQVLDYDGGPIHVVMGVLPSLGSGTELYRPVAFTLKF